MKKIVITGIGIVSPLGIGKDEFSNNLLAKKNIFKDVSANISQEIYAKSAGVIEGLKPEIFLGEKGLKYLDRLTILSLIAAKLAIEDSGFTITGSNHSLAGVILSIFPNLASAHQFNKVRVTEGGRFVEPMQFPNTVMNVASSHISIKYGITGFNITIANGMTGGLDAMVYAADLIDSGAASIVFAGGAIDFSAEIFACLAKLGLLNGGRKGFDFSEGACIFAIEDGQAALTRGAKIIARIEAYGMAFGKTQDSSYLAMKTAIDSAGLKPRDISSVFVSANSPEFDLGENAAINKLFAGENKFLNAVKPYLGESLSAGGAFNLAAAALSAKNSHILVNSLDCKGNSTSVIISN